MFRPIFLLLAAVIIIFAGNLQAQDFRVVPDSTEGIGQSDELCIFNCSLTNLSDAPNLILWEKREDLPEGWEVEICQESLLCWPSWVDSDTLRLEANQEDILQVKYHTSETEGTGHVILTLTSVADPDVTMELEFYLHTGDAPPNDWDFTVEPDSTEGSGVADELLVFNSLIINHSEEVNRVVWEKTDNLPLGWETEICQTSLLCWPSWVDSDTLVLQPQSTDTLQVKYFTSDHEGEGIVELSLVAVNDNDVNENLRFSLTVRSGGVDGGKKQNSGSFKFDLAKGMAGTSPFDLYLPAATDLSLKVFDLQGRLIDSYRFGTFSSGFHSITIDRSKLSHNGTYIIRAETKDFGQITRKLFIIR